MKFGSVCSGIEAASVAWKPLGWQAAWFSEIEKFPSAVLAHHYPDVQNLGDMSALPSRILSGEIEAPELLCGGTPCQAFSVAGLRRSLDDDRGNLSLIFCEIADAIDHVRLRAGKPASIIFWENVPGVLSTKDNAFGCFLAGLAGESEPLVAPGGKWTDAGCVFGSARAVAWRTFDAQYFGLAQRRRRVFVVASARDGFNPAEVLFEWEGVRRDSPPSRPSREGAAAGATPGAGGRWWDGGEVAATVTTNSDYQRMPDKANAQLVLQPIAIQGNLVGRTEGGPQGVAAPLAFKIRSGCEGGGKGYLGSEDTAFTISTTHDQQLAVPIAFGAQMSEPQVDIDLMQTLQAKNPMAVAFGGDLARSLTARHDSSPCADRGMDVVAVPVAFGVGESPEVGHCLRSGASKADKHESTTYVKTSMQVRRLTPRECERLQGFPDNYTAIPWKKKPADKCPDGPRYKALGNSWAVNVVRWIGARIAHETGADLA
jgi:DNA (cytosine-5)-methyltransferase 1